MAGSLEHESHTFINFANGTYQWVDVRRFTGAGDPDQALAALIGHDAFGQDYATGPGDDPDRHGPYWRKHLTPSAYERIEAAAAEQVLRGWAEQVAPLDDLTKASLDHEVYEPLRAAGTVFTLPDLGEQARHDWAGVHNEFHEFVAIATAGQLTLIVAADD